MGHMMLGQYVTVFAVVYVAVVAQLSHARLGGRDLCTECAV